MADSVKKVLFVNSEMVPYLPESPVGNLCRQLPQGIQERKKEIRAFMPKYGCINERKNQLHEVIRLSGMNIIISDVDRPLVIKVASISSARIQVYFIDNEDYFRRKEIYRDSEGRFFADNGERAIFYARGVLETVKKLRWAPDIIHCHGWISHVLPLYLKKAYKDDPVFSGAKVVLSLYATPLRRPSPTALRKPSCSAASSSRTSPCPRRPVAWNLLNLPRSIPTASSWDRRAWTRPSRPTSGSWASPSSPSTQPPSPTEATWTNTTPFTTVYRNEIRL